LGYGTVSGRRRIHCGIKYLFRILNSNQRTDVRCRVQIVPEKSSVRADHLVQALLPVLELVDVGKHDATVDGKLLITYFIVSDIAAV
jgi:hypothetical protein